MSQWHSRGELALGCWFNCVLNMTGAQTKHVCHAYSLTDTPRRTKFQVTRFDFSNFKNVNILYYIFERPSEFFLARMKA
jgi:hypothetical protein